VKARPADSDARSRSYRWRSLLVLVLVMGGALGLIARAVQLQLVQNVVLTERGDELSLRIVKIDAHRGTVTDRNGEPLALSTPVDSIWVNPPQLNDNIEQLPRLARALGQDQQFLARHITSNLDRRFVYLARHMPPEQAERIKALSIPGVYLRREYRRFYPAGEVTSHIVGFTTIDDKGQEGL
jgi:cell division protein FtsI (penicillin-binding protein 3)